MATLKDISKATGVSVTQVSRALGGYQDVNALTRKKVIDAAKRLGYRPNAMARGLKTGRTGIVALVLPAAIDAQTQEILFEMILGISSEFARRNHKLILHVDADGGPAVFRELLNWGGVDGFVLLDPQIEDPRIALLLECGAPLAVHGRDPSIAHPFVDVDNEQIGQDLARAALDAGHRRAHFINGPSESAFAQVRARSARALFDSVGAALTLTSGPMTRERGYAETLSIMQGPEAPTAIIAGNTMIARGTYDALTALGLRIPEDVSVLAHDDALSGYPVASFDPPLAGTRSALSQAWAALAVLLDAQIAKGAAKANGITIETSFSADGSLAEPRGVATGQVDEPGVH